MLSFPDPAAAAAAADAGRSGGEADDSLRTSTPLSVSNIETMSINNSTTIDHNLCKLFGLRVGWMLGDWFDEEEDDDDDDEMDICCCCC